MLIFTSIGSFLLCILVFCSRKPIDMYRAFSPKSSNMLHNIQIAINIVACGVIVTCTLIEYIFAKDLALLGLCVFFSLFIFNSIYIVILQIISSETIKKEAIKIMNDFLSSNKDKTLKDDKEIVIQFCKEYRGLTEKEAQTALKYIRKNTTSDSLVKPDVEVVFEFNGTKKKPCLNGYRPIHKIQEGSFTSGVHYYEQGSVEPNGVAKGTISFINPDAYPKSLWSGKKITIQEGNNVVGYATIVKVFNPILNKEIL